jgi:hypothetical protein
LFAAFFKDDPFKILPFKILVSKKAVPASGGRPFIVSARSFGSRP